MRENIEKVRTMLDKPELLCQLAEECTELGKAALKLRRVLTGINPTPLTEEEARKNFTEEVSDIMAVLNVLDVPVESEEIHGIQEYKFQRWVRRLEEGKCKVPQTSSKR